MSLLDTLGIDLPIIQAPMAGVSTPAHRSMKKIAELRVVSLMRRRAHAPEEPDLVLLRNAEFQIMLSELRYPPIHYP